MWKNWNPFRRKKDEQDRHEVEENKRSDGPTPTLGQGGKENTMSARLNGTNTGNSSRSYSFQANHSFSHVDVNDSNSSPKKISVSRHESLRSRNRMGFKDQMNTTLPTPKPQLGRRITRSPDDSMNKTFSGVQTPLLSSPIVPQIRKALESQAGMRSGSLSRQGKLVGRSSSLNYGTSRNLPRTTAGQVPWVRLKRRESLGLSDLVEGRMPQSPNTVKLAAPEPRHLPAPPSFKTTPVIVTTDASRSRVIDTQTVVSALREKRKRFGGSQQDEISSEDSWQSSAKRRRQDSSQSNASSVSIPPMPDSLPDLMGTPGASLLHIENLSSQRPSTVPATVDPYTSAPMMTAKPAGPIPGFGMMAGGLGGIPQVRGLGGPDLNPVNPMVLPPQHLQLYRYPTFPQHLQPLQHQHHHGSSSLQQRQAQYMAGGSGRNVNNSKSVLRSIQSSLSSSLRTRVNEATLRQHGIDLKRIRGNAEENKRRLSFSTETPTRASSSTEEPVQKISKPSQQPHVSAGSLHQAAQNQNAKEADEQKKEATVSTPTKRKIAEGVMLRKQGMSITPTASPARPLRVLPASTLVSADDFEQDRQQEYRRRVLDMLGGSEDGDPDIVGSTTTTTPSSVTPTAAPSLLPTSASSTSASVTSTSTINASLASLSKLVQATTPGVPSATSGAAASLPGTSATVGKPADSLLQLLKSDESKTTKVPGQGETVTLTGKPLSSPTSDQKSASLPATTSTVSASAATSLTTAPTTTATPAVVSQAASTAGFQVNFGAAFSAASKPSLPSGFSFGTTPVAVPATSLASTNSIAPAASNTVAPASEIVGKPREASSATATPAALGINSGAAPALSAQQSQTNDTAPKPFGFTAVAPASLAAAGQALGIPPTASTVTSSGGFNFNLATAAPASLAPTAVSASGGFNFATGLGAGMSQGSTLATSSAPTVPSSGFSFGGVSSLATATTTAPSSSAKPGFTFGSSSLSTSATTQAASGLGQFSAGNQPAATVGGFQGFGAAAQTSQASLSGFGNFTQMSSKSGQEASSTPNLQSGSAQNPAPMFGSGSSFGAGMGGALTQTTASSGGGFGAAASVPPAFNFSGSSSTTGQGQAQSKPFTFGASATSTAAATTAASIFGAGAPSGLTVFGGASASGTAGPSGFGSTPGTGFGGSTATTTAPMAATVFGAGSGVFGAVSAPSSTGPAFGSAPTSGFGAATTASSGFGTSGGAFTFGSGQSQQIVTTASTTGFGAVAAPGFGVSTFSSTSVPQPPAFGSSTGASSFGAASKPSIFGASSAAAGGFGAPTTQPPAFGISSGVASAFGSSQAQSTQASSTPFVFGSGAQSQQQPAAGNSQAFVFGPTPATSAQVSVFGSSTGAAASVTPFGQNQPASNSIFGSAAGTNKPAFGSSTPAPAFGASTNLASTPAPTFGSGLASAPAFGSATQQQKPGAAPAFGSTAFGSGMLQNNAFGAGLGSNQGGSSTGVTSPFGGASAFGSSTNKPNPFGASGSGTGAAAPVFNFGGNQPQQPPQAANGFGSGSSVRGSAPSAFNFGGAQAASAVGPQQQTGGFNFSARQSFASPGQSQGGFNFTAAAGSNPTFNFSGTPTANMVVPQPGTIPRPRVAAARRTGGRRAPRR